jgi:leucyl/phenylalanyl-tRNA--protein transferase
VPIEPPPTPWEFPSPNRADPYGLVAVGADLQPGTLLAAYRRGLFPMPFTRRKLGWWSPDPRGILPLEALKVSRSLRASNRKFEVRLDTEFAQVMRRCGDPKRPHGWINNDFIDAYVHLHEMGWAHSVETWLDGDLVGGLYGVRINGLFAGESMFHSVTDASKVAVMSTVDWLRTTGATLFDVQWSTPHLASLGVIEVPRDDYLEMLGQALHAGAGGWDPTH